MSKHTRLPFVYATGSVTIRLEALGHFERKNSTIQITDHRQAVGADGGVNAQHMINKVRHHCPKTQKAPPWAGLHYQVASTWHPGLLGEDVDRTRAFLALLDVEGDGLSLGQRFETACLYGAMMDEDVL